MSCLLPRFLTYDGQSAFVQMATIRPFVTGLQTGAASRLEPVVSQFSVGPVVQVRPMIEEDEGRGWPSNVESRRSWTSIN